MTSSARRAGAARYDENKSLHRLMATLFLLVTLATCAAGVRVDTSLVRTDAGVVRGARHGRQVMESTVRFMGIPYAKAKRFQYPDPHVPAWRGVRDASRPGPQCPQKCQEKEAWLYCLTKSSEECLTVNVWRPEPRRGEQAFPVIVYIHGGDFATGSGGAPVYDGHYLALMGRVVVVTFNYRLGAFGFLSIFDDYGTPVGNFGFRDQQNALVWVRNNIAAFKGDPNKITLMGDGAGCLSVVSHMTSHTSQDLFQSAILQGCPLAVPFRTEAEAQLQAEAFAHVIGCQLNDLSCYRGKSQNDVLTAQLAVKSESFSSNMLMSLYPWGPTIDDQVISHHPIDVFKDVSRFKLKPTIIGTTEKEGLYFKWNNFRDKPMTFDYYNKFVSSVTGKNVTSKSLASPSNDSRDDLAEFLTEFVFQCPAQFAADQIAKKQLDIQNLQLRYNPRSQQLPPQVTTNVWLYNYVYPISNLTQGLHSLVSSSCSGKSCHGQDVRNLFFSDALPPRERIDSEHLARQMVLYWSNFAKDKSVDGSRSFLQNMHLETRALQALWTTARKRPRGRQRISLPGSGNSGRFLATAPRASQASFTYWPSYSPRGAASRSTMMLKTPPLSLRRFHWQSTCSSHSFV